jgi:hypothetical protein
LGVGGGEGLWLSGGFTGQKKEIHMGRERAAMITEDIAEPSTTMGDTRMIGFLVASA